MCFAFDEVSGMNPSVKRRNDYADFANFPVLNYTYFNLFYTYLIQVKI